MLNVHMYTYGHKKKYLPGLNICSYTFTVVMCTYMYNF